MSNRDHGGNLDAAIAQFGGHRQDWLDLSTGINPHPYPVPDLPGHAWTALPDREALDHLIAAARVFWDVPDDLDIVAVPGASAAIAHLPLLHSPSRVSIPGPTYNEHAASFIAADWDIVAEGQPAEAGVYVHPNNPDGRIWQAAELQGGFRVIDESFCDVMPAAASLIMPTAKQPNTLILKSFGKFWGLAGVRLGFVIGDPPLLAKLSAMLGPWAVAGPALHIGAAALRDTQWAETTRIRLQNDALQLDQLMTDQGAEVVGGTPLFRLYDVQDAQSWQVRLARHHIWSRVFPYNPRWLRLGLPDAASWQKLEQALT